LDFEADSTVRAAGNAEAEDGTVCAPFGIADEAARCQIFFEIRTEVSDFGLARAAIAGRELGLDEFIKPLGGQPPLSGPGVMLVDSRSLL